MEWISQIKPPFNTPLNRQHWAAQGLVAHYAMNEMGGDLVHDSCGMNDGKLIFMAPMSPTSGWVPGPHGGAVAFDGSNDYALITGSAALKPTAEITIIAKVNPFVLSGWNKAVIFPYEATQWEPPYFSYQLGFNAGKANVGCSVTGIDYNIGSLDGSVMTANKWVTLAGTFKRGIINLYIDGAFNATKDVTGYGTSIIYTTRLNLVLGTDAEYFLSESLNGLISSVSIYNRALSAEEIAYLYAFPWCMYDRPVSAWEYNQQNRNFDHYYRRLMAA